MKSHGWLWCTEKNTYIKEGSISQELNVDLENEETEELTEANLNSTMPVELERYLPLLDFLESNKEQLEAMLQGGSTNQIPKYNFHGGNKVTKSVFMSSNLDQLIRDFSTEMGVSQRVMFETALIQFMERYGYADQIAILLSN